MKKSFLLSLSLLLSSLLNGCQTIKVPDIPVCTEINLAKGRCTMTVTDLDLVIDDTNLYQGKTWWELRPTLIYIPYPAWIELKTTFIKICKKKLIDCNESISSWDRRIDAVDEKVEGKFEGLK